MPQNQHGGTDTNSYWRMNRQVKHSSWVQMPWILFKGDYYRKAPKLTLIYPLLLRDGSYFAKSFLIHNSVFAQSKTLFLPTPAQALGIEKCFFLDIY